MTDWRKWRYSSFSNWENLTSAVKNADNDLNLQGPTSHFKFLFAVTIVFTSFSRIFECYNTGLYWGERWDWVSFIFFLQYKIVQHICVAKHEINEIRHVNVQSTHNTFFSYSIWQNGYMLQPLIRAIIIPYYNLGTGKLTTANTGRRILL